MNEKKGTTYYLLVFKEKRQKISLFLEKRHGEREMEKLKAIRLLLCTRHDANYTINIEIY